MPLAPFKDNTFCRPEFPAFTFSLPARCKQGLVLAIEVNVGDNVVPEVNEHLPRC